jgi:hypothetical protein
VSRLLALSLAAATLLAGVAAPAHAQGGLLRKMKQKADEANRALGGEAAAPSGPRRAPSYDETVLEITDARLDQLVKGLAAERAAAKEFAALEAKNKSEAAAHKAATAKYEREMLSFQTKRQNYDACRMDVINSAQGSNPHAAAMQQRMASMSEADLQKAKARMEDLQRRHEAAEKKGDQATIGALRDTIMREMQQLTGVSPAQAAAAQKGKPVNVQAELAKCGDEPLPPEAPQGSESGASNNVYDYVGTAGRKASGLEEQQYSVLRERVTFFVQEKGKLPANSSYAFSEAEVAALQARAKELMGYQVELTESPSEWLGRGE